MTDRADQPLIELMNIGPTSAQWLNDVGIFTLADLEDAGPVEAYRLVSVTGRKISLNLVYALQGALLGIHWTELPAELRDELKRTIENLPK